MESYGSVTYNKINRCWDIVCEPQVAIRLKRWFPRVDTYQYGTHSIGATPENCRDLEAFLTRYPMEIYPGWMLKEQADKHRERQALIEKLLSGEHKGEFQMKLPPREYQSLATNMWLTAGGLLLADDVGLGKTCVAIAGFTDPRTTPALVVTLTHLPWQWRDEVEKFTDLKCHILKKGHPYDFTDKKGNLPDVIITNYSKIGGWAETLAPIVKSVVFDECQQLRHDSTGKYLAAKHIADNVPFRLGLSATPIYNYGGEIFNVLNVITPDALGDWEEFRREWVTYKDGPKPIIKDPAAFGVYARREGLMLRRTRMEVKRELPGIIRVPHKIDADPEVLQRMQGQAIELAKLILKQGQEWKGQKMQAAGEFDMKMRQATGIAKAPFVAQFVRFLVEDNDTPVLLFGWHREVYDIWNEHFRGNGRDIRDLKPVMFTGSETAVQKEAAKQAFVKGESKIMMMSLRAGAGINDLQNVCHVCVFGELDWSPGVHEQDEGRLHRDGQDEPVTSYYLLSDHGSDPIMSDILGVKKQQIEGLRDPNQDLVTKLQIEEDYIKKLAAKFLQDHGIALPEENSTGTEKVSS